MNSENLKAMDIIIKQIKTMINQKVSQLSYDKTFLSLILNKNEDGTYKISYLGHEYNVPNALPIDLKIGQYVWVKIPSGTLRKMHICNIVKNEP